MAHVSDERRLEFERQPVHHLCQMDRPVVSSVRATTVVCVAAVVHRGDRILLVRQSKGHSMEGQVDRPVGTPRRRRITRRCRRL